MTQRYAPYLEKPRKTPNKDFKLFVTVSDTHVISIVSSAEKQQKVLTALSSKGLSEGIDFSSDFYDLTYPITILETYGKNRKRVYECFQNKESLDVALKAKSISQYSAYSIKEDYIPMVIGNDCMGLMDHSHSDEDE